MVYLQTMKTMCLPTLAFFMLLFCTAVHSETLTYQTVTGSETTATVFTIHEVENGKKVRAEYNPHGIASFSEVTMTDSYSTQSWKYLCEKEKSDFSGWRSNDTVLVSGTYKSQKVSKRYPLKGVVWKQMFPFDLRDFVLSDSTTTCFCGVSTIEIATMQLGTLEVKKVGMERLSIGGKNRELLHVKVAPPGLLSVFWHGDYWYDKNNGTMVKSVSSDFPGAPSVSSTLVD